MSSETLQAPTGGTWRLPAAAFDRHTREAEARGWDAGMTHALTWLGQRDSAKVMAKDNPYRKVGAFKPTGFPPRPLRKDKVG